MLFFFLLCLAALVVLVGLASRPVRLFGLVPALLFAYLQPLAAALVALFAACCLMFIKHRRSTHELPRLPHDGP